MPDVGGYVNMDKTEHLVQQRFLLAEYYTLMVLITVLDIMLIVCLFLGTDPLSLFAKFIWLLSMSGYECIVMSVGILLSRRFLSHFMLRVAKAVAVVPIVVNLVYGIYEITTNKLYTPLSTLIFCSPEKVDSNGSSDPTGLGQLIQNSVLNWVIVNTTFALAYSLILALPFGFPGRGVTRMLPDRNYTLYFSFEIGVFIMRLVGNLMLIAGSNTGLCFAAISSFSTRASYAFIFRHVCLADSKHGWITRKRHASRTENLVKESLGGIWEDYKLSLRDIQFEKLIGQGGTASVLKGWWRGVPVAVKQYPVFLTNVEALEVFEREVFVMSKLHHPNILRLIGAAVTDCEMQGAASAGSPVAISKAGRFMGPDLKSAQTHMGMLCVITEYIMLGSLDEILANKSIRITWNQVLKWALDTAKGMHYLHSLEPPLLHRDLKSPNLLVDEHMRIIISDFGLSRFEDAVTTKKTFSTPVWAAPEVLSEQVFTVKSDVYSYGIVLWELITRDAPHAGVHPGLYASRVVKEDYRAAIPVSCPEPYVQLIKKCWAPKPEDRPTFEEVLTELQDVQTMTSGFSGLMPLRGPRL
eukprot:GFYU01011854.1.p1 GENE.GFYU01011854.1~~GFYU01011854.1.p1  ORF type:complete len:582 (+),score=92.13 GFYU01011854.1:622-2367(+)